jgi:hypothetical protein
VLSLAAAAVLMAAMPATADAQRAQRRVAVQRPVTRPVYRPVARYYRYPYYYRHIWWASYGYPLGFYPYRYPYGYGWSQYGYYRADVTTALRLQITPREAEVFVDGYSAGLVDDFDGVFQRLRLMPGGHTIEIYLDGYRMFRQNIHLAPGASATIRHTLAPLGPGEAMEPRPQPDDDRPDVSDEDDRESSARPDDRAPRNPARGRGAARDSSRAPFGTLVLRVQPGDAEILVDGERWSPSADSSRFAVELAAGRHTIEVRKPGFQTYREDVLIRPNAPTNLNVGLTP